MTKAVVLPGRVTITNYCDSDCSATLAGRVILAWETRQAGRVGVFHTSWLLLHFFYLVHDQQLSD